MTSDHGPEVFPLLVNRQLPAQSKRLFDLAKLGTHALPRCLAPELEASAVDPRAAVMCQPEEVEGFWLALTAFRSPLGSISTELDEARLFRVQTECECRQALLEIVQEPSADRLERFLSEPGGLDAWSFIHLLAQADRAGHGEIVSRWLEAPGSNPPLS